MGRKVRMKLTEMERGEAQFVSLVGKGANRQPIKIMKSDSEENTGMDWTKLFHNADAVQKAEISPEILAIAVAPGEDIDRVKEALTKADLNTDDIREFRTEEGLQATFFVQKTDVAPGEGGEHQTVVKLSDGVSAVCLVAQKAFQPFSGSESFDENMQAQGFFPGVHIAQAVLEDTIFEISMKAMSPVEMAEKIKSATDEFAGAVQKMTAALPASVFKLEDIVRKGSTTGNAAPGEDPTTGNSDSGEPAADLLSNESGGKSSIDPMSSAQKSDESRTGEENGLDGKGDEGTGAEDLTSAEEKAKAAKKKNPFADDSEEDEDKKEGKAKEDPNAELKALIAGLGETLTAAVEGVQKQVSDLDSRVSAAETVATKADEATRGRVSATAPEDDGLETVTRKGFGDMPLLDTAIRAAD